MLHSVGEKKKMAPLQTGYTNGNFRYFTLLIGPQIMLTLCKCEMLPNFFITFDTVDCSLLEMASVPLLP